MPRIMLVEPGAGAPDVLPLEAWVAISSAPVFAAPGDTVAARLRDAGIEVTELDGSDGHEPTASGTIRGKNLLSAHHHGAMSEPVRALAERLTALAADHGAVTFLVSDPAVVRAVMERALGGEVEVEVVVGRQPRGHRLLELVRVMARLRAPDGCPWDAEQTHQTLAKHLLDETYELLDAIDAGDERHIAEELGDLLLQVVFHAEMGADASTFDIDDVAQGLIEKLVRRHPHVFGDVRVSGASEVVENWDRIKSHEKDRSSATEGIPEALPALALAQKLQRRAAAEGFDWRDDRGALDKVAEEAGELAREGDPARREEEFGDLLFALCALARRLDLDAESALRRAARRFRDRFVSVERAVASRGVAMSDLSEDELVSLWDDAKRA